MLHYIYVYVYLILLILITLFFKARYFISLLVSFESLVASVVLLLFFVGSFYNLFYLTGLGLMVLMFGGLELAIALILFQLNV